jgi:hypothetical protein
LAGQNSGVHDNPKLALILQQKRVSNRQQFANEGTGSETLHQTGFETVPHAQGTHEMRVRSAIRADDPLLTLKYVDSSDGMEHIRACYIGALTSVNGHLVFFSLRIAMAINQASDLLAWTMTLPTRPMQAVTSDTSMTTAYVAAPNLEKLSVDLAQLLHSGRFADSLVVKHIAVDIARIKADIAQAPTTKNGHTVLGINCVPRHQEVYDATSNPGADCQGFWTHHMQVLNACSSVEASNRDAIVWLTILLTRPQDKSSSFSHQEKVLRLQWHKIKRTWTCISVTPVYGSPSSCF